MNHRPQDWSGNGRPRAAKPVPRSRHRRAELLDAARTLVFNEGVGRFTMRRLGEAVGITEAAVYRHFTNKEAVLLALIDLLFAGWHDEVDRIMARPEPAAQKLHRLADFHVSHLVKREFNPLMLLSEAAAPEGLAIRQALFTKGAVVTQALTTIVTAGVRTGEFADDLDVPAAVRAALGLLQGTLVRWSLARSSAGMRRELAASLTLLIRGFAPSGELRRPATTKRPGTVRGSTGKPHNRNT